MSEEDIIDSQQQQEEDSSTADIATDYLIPDLENKIFKLEATVSELKALNEKLQLEVSLNTSYATAKRLSFHPRNRPLSLNPSNQSSSQLLELAKDRTELQELTDKMLNMLTDKEIENKALREEAEAQEDEHQFQLKELTAQLEELTSAYEELKHTAHDESDYNSLLNEYTELNERTAAQLSECYAKEGLMHKENEDLTIRMQQLNNEIQRLELDNLHLINANIESNEFNIEQRQSETSSLETALEQINSELALSEESKELLQAKFDVIVSQKDITIQNLSERNEALIKRLAECNDNFAEKLDYAEKSSKALAKELSIAKSKVSELQRHKEEVIKKNSEYKALLDKRTEELKDINTTAITLKKSKENEITQLEEQYNKLNEAYLALIDENRSLSIEISSKAISNGTDSDSLDSLMKAQASANETAALKKDIAKLKEQLAKKEEEALQSKAGIEAFNELKSENKVLKEQRDQMSHTYENQFRSSKRSSIKMSNDLVIQKKKTLNYKRQCSAVNEISANRQVTQLNILRENDKKFYQEQIDRLKAELTEMKLKLATQSFEKDSLIVKYRNIINTIAVQCKKKGINLNINI